MSEIKSIRLNGVTYKLGSGDGLTDSIKSALLQSARNVSWNDQSGRSYYEALELALYPPANLLSITATYTQSGTVYDTDTLDGLKTDLVVTAHYSDSTTATVTAYTLSGTLTPGTSTITVSYGGKDTTINVTVTHYEPITTSVTWSGTGVENTSSVIDATGRDVYITVPFDSTDSRIVSGATVSDLTFAQRTLLYNDSACTDLAGYWYTDTQTVEATQRLSAQQPYVPFDADTLIAPRGYYVKIVLEKMNATVFSSNSDARKYLNAQVETVTLR